MVAGAACLWGLDGLFRNYIATTLPASTIVLAEHLLLVLAVSPLLFASFRQARASFDRTDWLMAIAIGAGASALATIFITTAFSRGDFITPVVLQKLQPLVAILGARVLLGERLHERFWIYAGAALVFAWLLAFADPLDVHVRSLRTASFAIAAAVLWGAGTVFGRRLSQKVDFKALTTLRFTFGLPASALAVIVMGSRIFPPAKEMDAVAATALVSGLIAMMLYYRGMHTTPAAVATLAELTFPVTAAFVGVIFLNQSLSKTQWIGGVGLTATVALLSWQSSHSTKAVGVEDPSGARTYALATT